MPIASATSRRMTSEPYAEAVLAAEPAGADPISERYQGGTFCAAEYSAKTPPE